MKWLAILLSIYLIVLSGVPCPDAAPEAGTDAQIITHTNSNSANHSPAADLCSPLCICSCCAGFALQTPTQNVSPFNLKIIIPAPFYQPLAVLQPSFSIWQPPQL